MEELLVVLGMMLTELLALGLLFAVIVIGLDHGPFWLFVVTEKLKERMRWMRKSF